MKYSINAPHAPEPDGPYSQGTTAGRLVFAAGQLGRDRDNGSSGRHGLDMKPCTSHPCAGDLLVSTACRGYGQSRQIVGIMDGMNQVDHLTIALWQLPVSDSQRRGAHVGINCH